MSNEKRCPGRLGYTGDDKLPSYMGVIINHDIRIPPLTKDPSINQPVFHGVRIRSGFKLHKSWASRQSLDLRNTATMIYALLPLSATWFQEIIWVFPNTRGKTPKMDGENNGKPYDQMDDLAKPLWQHPFISRQT